MLQQLLLLLCRQLGRLYLLLLLLLEQLLLMMGQLLLELLAQTLMLLCVHFTAIVIHVDHLVLIILIDLVLILHIGGTMLRAIVLAIIVAIAIAAARAAVATARGAALVALRVAAIAALLLHPLVLGATILEPHFDLAGRETQKHIEFASGLQLTLSFRSKLVNKFNESFNSICLPTPAPPTLPTPLVLITW